jgi:hypothetical protein
MSLSQRYELVWHLRRERGSGAQAGDNACQIEAPVEPVHEFSEVTHQKGSHLVL